MGWVRFPRERGSNERGKGGGKMPGGIHLYLWDTARVSQQVLVDILGCTGWTPSHTWTPLWKLKKEGDV